VSYVFDVSEEHNDLFEMDHQLRYYLHGDYKGANRVDANGHLIYNVELFDKRYALQFKMMFNATVVKWDESDDEEIVTEAELIERGYVEMNIKIPQEKSEEFRQWCKARDFPIVDGFKFIHYGIETMTLWVPADQQVMVKLTWA
jgi:shikimate 5-dehydrogenase